MEMTNKEKLEALKAFLKENDVKFIENYQSNFGVMMDLKLPELMIAVFLSEGKDHENIIYNTGKGRIKLYYIYNPFFIRESETAEFVIEKMKNCIIERMMWLQKKFEKSYKK
jgi:hypothetical protein